LTCNAGPEKDHGDGAWRKKARVRQERWRYGSKILGIGCSSEVLYKWNLVDTCNCASSLLRWATPATKGRMVQSLLKDNGTSMEKFRSESLVAKLVASSIWTLSKNPHPCTFLIKVCKHISN